MSQEAEDLLRQLAAEGVSPWLAPSGPQELDSLLHNGTLGGHFQGAVLPSGASARVIQRSCDALWPLFRDSQGAAGQVSVPLHTGYPGEPESLITAVRALHGKVRRPNVVIRVPMARAGVEVLAECLAERISVDASLVVSDERYAEVLDAYVEGMERALAHGHDLAGVSAVTSFPVGAFDREVEARLDRLGVPGTHEVRGAAGLAMARRMYRLREERLAGGWWRTLRAAGARPPRLLWTGGNQRSIGDLVSWNTAIALSTGALGAARSVKLVGDTLLNTDLEARLALQLLEQLGVPAGEVAVALETAELGRLQRDRDGFP